MQHKRKLITLCMFMVVFTAVCFADDFTRHAFGASMVDLALFSGFVMFTEWVRWEFV